MQARVTSVMRNHFRSSCTRVRVAAIRIAKLHVLRRRLQGFTDRIVVRNCQRRRLMTFHQQERNPGCLRNLPLNLSPAARNFFGRLLGEYGIRLGY